MLLLFQLIVVFLSIYVFNSCIKHVCYFLNLVFMVFVFCFVVLFYCELLLQQFKYKVFSLVGHREMEVVF